MRNVITSVMLVLALVAGGGVNHVEAGEKVAVSGTYLIDSESKLRGGAGDDHSQHTGGGAQPVGPQPAKNL